MVVQLQDGSVVNPDKVIYVRRNEQRECEVHFENGSFIRLSGVDLDDIQDKLNHAKGWFRVTPREVAS